MEHIKKKLAVIVVFFAVFIGIVTIWTVRKQSQPKLTAVTWKLEEEADLDGNELSSYFTNVTGYVFGAFLLLFAPWADTAIASSALVLYRVATYFFPFLLSVIVFLREEKKSLKGFDAQSA